MLYLETGENTSSHSFDKKREFKWGGKLYSTITSSESLGKSKVPYFPKKSLEWMVSIEVIAKLATMHIVDSIDEPRVAIKRPKQIKTIKDAKGSRTIKR